MKFMEDEKLQLLTQNLTNQTVGINRIVNGRIECFSCKRGQNDKKASYKLKEKYAEEDANIEQQSVRLITDLILTLNASFPDYDFSSVSPSQFQRIENPNLALSNINNYLAEFASYNKTSFLPNLWKAINEVINLAECEVYEYKGEIVSRGNLLWEFHYFFSNKSLKRIVFFSCNQTHVSIQNGEFENLEEEDSDIEAYDMDIVED
uniref:Repressor of RNA polymerase III transcription n=1 Tax=Leptocylindrus danicus TaxID=163516 RepID=A0A7S2LRD0_9STRA|mmetsp:Transcript_8290/g.12331  ORF Transcript_8290/g.12331 Transcript_8290/m.12331 type:complete len:206 (+) Transcript_8290:101-718(+)